MTLLDWTRLDEAGRVRVALAHGFLYARTATGRATLQIIRRVVAR